MDMPQFYKSERVENKELREKIKRMPCLVCGRGPVDCAHITTKKLGGDAANNVIPLCRDCHISQHQMGIKSFVKFHGLPIDCSGIYPRLNFEWKI